MTSKINMRTQATFYLNMELTGPELPSICHWKRVHPGSSILHSYWLKKGEIAIRKTTIYRDCFVLTTLDSEGRFCDGPYRFGYPVEETETKTKSKKNLPAISISFNSNFGSFESPLESLYPGTAFIKHIEIIGASISTGVIERSGRRSLIFFRWLNNDINKDYFGENFSGNNSMFSKIGLDITGVDPVTDTNKDTSSSRNSETHRLEEIGSREVHIP